MAEGEVRQYWVRNDRGTMWGPLTLPTIELLVESGSIKGKLQVSEDGLNFAFPWRFPEARDSFPRALWGDGAPEVPAGAPASSPGPRPAAAPGGQPPPGAPVAGPGAAPMAGPGTRPPMAGPGAAPMAGPGAAPMAGPGTRPPMAGPGAAPMAGPGTRPPQGPMPMAGPGTRPPVAPGAAPAAGPGPQVPPGRPVAAPQPGAVPGRPPVAPGTPQAAGPTVAPNAVARGATAPTPPPFANPTAAAPVAAPPPAPGPAVVPEDASPFTVPAQGPLDQHSSIRLYGRIAAGEQTGLLSLLLSDRTVLIHFRKGNPEFVDSSHAEDALGTSLVGAKLLTPEQLQQAESSRERFGGDLLAALFGQGLLQPASAFTYLAQRAVSILSKGLRAESGTFTFEPRDLPGQKAMPLGNRWAVLSDTVRRLPTGDLKRRLAPVLQLPIMKSGGLVAASELRLTPHEVRALAVIDGVRSVAQLLNDFPQDADHLLRISFLLKELDAVSFAAPARAAAVSPPPGASATPPPPAAAQRPAPPPQATAARPPGAPPPAAAPQAGPGAQRPPPVVGASSPGAPAQPGAPRPAGPPVVGPSAGAASPPRPAGAAPVAGPGATAARPPGAPPPAAGAAQPRPPVAAPQAPQRPAPPTVAAAPANAPGSEEIPALRQLAMAMKQQNFFQRLSLTEQTNASAVKIAYFRLAKLYHPDTLPQGAPPELEKLKAEVFAYIGDAYRMLSDDKSRAEYIEELKSGGAGADVDINSILMAEELFQKSCILVKARKFPEAVKMLDEAIKLNAEEAEFYAWRGYARFFMATDKKAAQPEAFREIQNAIKRNERCAPAHYFLGVIAKLVGDASSALKHFKRTVELQPDHIDAQREIRMATQKK
ncbi:DnaJ domain-containing protein [Pyxidicoccus trucidator]|uniref:DnaJ domain-containing protein n=1 Tax=Pyxidicoccus trucidator TaxID=2709662 RepID=UPI0013D8FBE6|nr:DnaJ domain-containing protein [Pyxidicoccus trucidator]